MPVPAASKPASSARAIGNEIREAVMAKKSILGQISHAFTTKGAAPESVSLAVQLETLKEENARLTRALEELSMLNELAREIGASRDLRGIMDRIIHRSLKAAKAEQCAITMVSEQSLEPMKTLVRAMVTSAEHQQFHLTQNLLG